MPFHWKLIIKVYKSYVVCIYTRKNNQTKDNGEMGNDMLNLWNSTYSYFLFDINFELMHAI